MTGFRPPIHQSKRSFQVTVRPLWEKFQADGEESELHNVILDSIVSRCEHPYPWLHRICDVTLEGEVYRVSRCARCSEDLSFEPRVTGEPEPGVPYELTGERLRDWVERESASPSKGET